MLRLLDLPIFSNFLNLFPASSHAKALRNMGHYLTCIVCIYLVFRQTPTKSIQAPGPMLSSRDTPMDKVGTVATLTQMPVFEGRHRIKQRHAVGLAWNQPDYISPWQSLPHVILPWNMFSKLYRIKEMAASSVIKRILTSVPGSQAAAQSWETKKSGASYIIASNLILDRCWFPESNKCQEFYEGRKQIRGQGLESSPLGSSISVPDKVKAQGHALGFLESQLEKMPILKPLSLKRLTEETQGCPREYCSKPDVSAPPCDTTTFNESYTANATKEPQKRTEFSWERLQLKDITL